MATPHQEQQQPDPLDRDLNQVTDNPDDRNNKNIVHLKQTLFEYLEHCHQLNLNIDPGTKSPLPSRADTTNPVGKPYPRVIIPWESFQAKQEEIWNLLGRHTSFFEKRDFPYDIAKDEAESNVVKDMTEDIDVREFNMNSVSSAVATLSEMASNDADIRATLGIFSNLTVSCLALPENSDAAYGGDVEQCCSFSFETNGSMYPCLSIEHVAPWKFSLSEIMIGLSSEIHLPEDIVNSSAEIHQSRSLCAAVVTQLYAAMIRSGTSYGFICTGEAYIFLHIPMDSSKVYVSVQVPKLMVNDDDERGLYHTAVAQIFALSIRAVREGPQCQKWYEGFKDAALWKETFQWSLKRNVKESHPPLSCYASVGEVQGGGNGQVQPVSSWKTMRDRKFCSQKCLLGLLCGDSIDKNCPNAEEHGPVHLRLDLFWRSLKKQLTTDRGLDAYCTPMGLTGGSSSVFKVQLRTNGYTLVAKGVEKHRFHDLVYENNIYRRLQDIQGRYVPVCLGIIDLGVSYHFNTRECGSFMLLSYCGVRPTSQVMNRRMMTRACKALTEIHRRGVLHRDVGPFNLLCEGERMAIMDFEFSEVHQPETANLYDDDLFAVEMGNLKDGLES
ncbi:hypothetical protein CP533_4868 [Ophiocordyceps camponoti-saundersi (nom. inval.)]|nr:hypothetical protein CP533_4868 [Ophiocordyceps camponoti-saundersi (nom. inval.)]